MIHKDKFKFAGKKVKIKEKAKHFHNQNFGGSEFEIKDWYDRVSGDSWKSKNSAACYACAIRIMKQEVKEKDDEVLYGKIDNVGCLVHISEIDQIQN